MCGFIYVFVCAPSSDVRYAVPTPDGRRRQASFGGAQCGRRGLEQWPSVSSVAVVPELPRFLGWPLLVQLRHHHEEHRTGPPHCTAGCRGQRVSCAVAVLLLELHNLRYLSKCHNEEHEVGGGVSCMSLTMWFIPNFNLLPENPYMLFSITCRLGSCSHAVQSRDALVSCSSWLCTRSKTCLLLLTSSGLPRHA